MLLLTTSSRRLLLLFFLSLLLSGGLSFCIVQERSFLDVPSGTSNPIKSRKWARAGRRVYDNDSKNWDDELRPQVVASGMVLEKGKETRRRPNLNVQRLLTTILNRYSNDGEDTSLLTSQLQMHGPLHSNWTKLRNYLYRSADKLTVTQVDQVCTFLNQTFDEDTQRHVLQTTPRILRKTVETNLEPIVNFLRDLYGDELMKQAIQRNPTLLLTRDAGYNVQSLDLVSPYLRKYLPFTETSLKKLQNTAPFVFELPLSQVLSVLKFLRDILTCNTSLTEEQVQAKLVKLILLCPTLLQLSVDNLQFHVQYLKDSCCLQEASGDMALLIQRNPAVLGLSIQSNLEPTIKFLSQLLRARTKPEDLRKCILMHPPILSLSLKNLESKVEYFLSLEQRATATTTTTKATSLMPALDTSSPSLAARILRRAPAVYSLSLDSIRSKVDFLSRIWGVDRTVTKDWTATGSNDEIKIKDTKSNNRSSLGLLSSLLSEDPIVLTLSLEGNLRPTVHFFNRTGYIYLDEEWRPMMSSDDLDNNDNNLNKDNSKNEHDQAKLVLLRPRCLATSLYQRLLPRWHFALKKNETNHYHNVKEKTRKRVSSRSSINPSTDTMAPAIIVGNDDTLLPLPLLPLHVLAMASDTSFCKYMRCDFEEYREFQRHAIPRLKFSSQFDVWLKTGRPIDIE